MDQFLGISDDHSSLVTHDRSLRTVYVIPKFLVVFDELFQIVFSLGDNDMLVNAVCNQLFESNWNVYAED